MGVRFIPSLNETTRPAASRRPCYSRPMQLRNAVAIVTGSGGEGSGRAEAIRLASEGCHVVVSDINESGGNETVHCIAQAGGQAGFCRCDVSHASEVQALVAFAQKTFGGLDIHSLVTAGFVDVGDDHVAAYLRRRGVSLPRARNLEWLR